LFDVVLVIVFATLFSQSASQPNNRQEILTELSNCLGSRATWHARNKSFIFAKRGCKRPSWPAPRKLQRRWEKGWIFSVSRVCRMGPGNMMSKQLSVTPLSPFLVIPRWIGFCFSLKRSGVHTAMHKDTGVIAKMPPPAGNPITMAAWFHTTPVKMSRSEHLKDLAPLALGRCGGGWKKINIGRY